MWQNSKTQIVTQLKKTQIVTKLKNSNCDGSNSDSSGSSSRVIPYKSTEKNMTIFFLDYWPKKSIVVDILVVKTFFFFNLSQFEFCHILSFFSSVLSQFEFEFCPNLSFWVLSQIANFSSVTIWVFELPKFWFSSFVTNWVLEFCHYLRSWGLSQF